MSPDKDPRTSGNPRASPPRVARRPSPRVVCRQSEDVVDLSAWARQYVDAILALYDTGESNAAYNCRARRRPDPSGPCD